VVHLLPGDQPLSRLSLPAGGASPHGRQAIYENIAARLHESLVVIRDIRRRGEVATPEIDQLIATPPGSDIQCLTAPDPLEQMGRRYGLGAARYLASRPEAPFSYPPRPDGPIPVEVLAWFSIIIPVKIYRALVSRLSAIGGRDSCEVDALQSARVALIGIERSRAAIAALREEDTDPRLEPLETQLVRLAVEVSERFPRAITVVRPGLDVPVPLGVGVN
jgi:hypothetical protein